MKNQITQAKEKIVSINEKIHSNCSLAVKASTSESMREMLSAELDELKVRLEFWEDRFKSLLNQI